MESTFSLFPNIRLANIGDSFANVTSYVHSPEKNEA